MSLLNTLLLKSKEYPSKGRLKLWVPEKIGHNDTPICEADTLIQRRLIGGPAKVFTERVMLLVGSTGSGKTSLLNTLLNYLYDVRYDSPLRLKLLNELEESSENGDTSLSQTKSVIAYTFNNTKLPFNLTVIDTPGFGDTSGSEMDSRTAIHIEAFFSSSSTSHGLHAIGLVLHSRTDRLTSGVLLAMRQLGQLLPRQINANIVPVLTHDDGSQPSALDALSAGGISFNGTHSIIVNNAAFKQIPENKLGQQLAELGFASSIESLDTFFSDFLSSAMTIELGLCTESIKQRRDLEMNIAMWQHEIERCFEEAAVALQNMELLSEIDLLLLDSSTSPSPRPVNVQLKKTKRELIAKKLPFPRSLNCTKCQETCHMSCLVTLDNWKRKCDRFDSNGYCQSCDYYRKNKCSSMDHVIQPSYYKTTIQTDSTTTTTIHYDSKDKINGDLRQFAQTVRTMEQSVIDHMREVNQLSTKFKQYTMSSASVSNVDLIKGLIDQETYNPRVDKSKARLKLLNRFQTYAIALVRNQSVSLNDDMEQYIAQLLAAPIRPVKPPIVRQQHSKGRAPPPPPPSLPSSTSSSRTMNPIRRPPISSTSSTIPMKPAQRPTSLRSASPSRRTSSSSRQSTLV